MDITKTAIIMEFKIIRTNSKMSLEEGLNAASKQMNKKLYDTELINRGIENIMKLTLSYKGKEVLIEESDK